MRAECSSSCLVCVIFTYWMLIQTTQRGVCINSSVWLALFMGDIHLARIGAVWVTVKESVGVVFLILMWTQKLCVSIFVKMRDLLSISWSHSCVITRPVSKQCLCWLMFYEAGPVCVTACTVVCVCLTHRVCIARSEVKVPLARVWILLS